MKAAWLPRGGVPLEIREVTEPRLIGGSVKVKVVSAHVLSYLKEVFSNDGSRINVPAPYIPGPAAIGTIEEFADDVIGLSKGQLVFCQPLYRSPTNRTVDNSILIGLFGVGAESKDLLEWYKNGAFAEKALYPAACITPIFKEFDPNRLAAMNVLTIAYGALMAAGFRPSQTVIVNGATGNIGACVVLLASVMAAAQVIAVGRDEDTLDALKAINSRITTATLGKDKRANVESITSKASERHILIDASAADTPEPTMACIDALSAQGVAVLIGGVRSDLTINYSMLLNKQLTIKGNFMYPNTVPTEVLRLIEAGLIDLSLFSVHPYPLAEINDAIASAPQQKGLAFNVINPQK